MYLNKLFRGSTIFIFHEFLREALFTSGSVKLGDVRPSVRAYRTENTWFLRVVNRGWTSLLDLGSLNYEFWRVVKKTEKQSSKTRIKKEWRHVRGPLLDPVLDPSGGTFWNSVVWKRSLETIGIQAWKWSTEQRLWNWRTRRRPYVVMILVNLDTLSDVRSASRPCLARCI